MKAEIRKHPWAAVLIALVAGGLFFSNVIKSGASRVKRVV